MDWKAITDLIPLALSGLKAGTPEAAAFNQGYLHSKQQIEQSKRLQGNQDLQRQQLLRQDQLTQAQIGNLSADNQRADQELQLKRLGLYRGAMGDAANQIAQTATDPIAATTQLASQGLSLTKQFGVPPESIAGNLPPMAPLISNRQKKQAADLYGELEKRYAPKDEHGNVTDPNWELSVRTQDSHPAFPGKTARDLRMLYETPVLGPGGMAPTPAVRAPHQLAGTESERATTLLAKIRGATAAGDPNAAAKFQQQYDDLLKAKGDLGKADDRPPTNLRGPNGLLPGQEFGMEEKLARTWTDTTKAQREMQRQFSLMQTGLRRFAQGDKNGGSQAVLVTFQKILDPTSVVRESEYARSGAGMSLLGRLEGFAERLSAGGAGVPEADLRQMVETGRQFLAGMGEFTAGQRQRIEAQVKKYGLNRDSVLYEIAMPSAADQVTTPTGNRPATATMPTGAPKNPFRR